MKLSILQSAQPEATANQLNTLSDQQSKTALRATGLTVDFYARSQVRHTKQRPQLKGVY